ncbi:MAG: PAS domain S-box protein [Thermoguttaceae bacterium]
MEDHVRTTEQLLAELADLRQRASHLEQTEKLLRQSEARYHTLVDTVPQLMYWTDASRETIQCSRRWHEYIGQSTEEAQGFGWMKAVHPDDVAVVRQRINESQANGTPYEAEYRVRRASDGSYRWHLARSVPMAGKDGEIIGWFGYATDIDDQKRAEAALRESEERFRGAFDEGPIGIVLVGADGRVQHCNQRFCEMLGFSEEEILNRGLAAISHPDDRETDRSLVPRLWRDEIPRYQIEKRYVRKDGQVIWGQLTVSLLRDEGGRSTSAIGIVEDLTERKRAEERARRGERTLRALIDANPESLVLLDPEGIILIANETAAHRLGRTIDEMIGQNVFALLPEDLAPQRHRRVADVIRTGKPVRFEDKRCGRYYENAIYPVIDEEGGVTAVAVLGIDRTERRQAEEALREARDELERRVEDRTAELVAANTALRQSRDELQTIYDEMIEGCMIVDVATKRFLRANAQMCQMLGYSEEGLLAASIKDIYPSEELANELRTFQAVVEGQRSINENCPVVRKDGSVFYADITGRRILYDGRPCLLSLFRDVTERKQVQETLEREHRTLRHLLRSSDHERQLIAYEIHDGLAQYLAGAIMQFEVYHHSKKTKPSDAAMAYDAGMTMLRQGHSDARRLISGVRPPILDESGVVAAIVHLVNEERRQNGPKIEFHDEVAFDRLVPIVENAVYRIVQEGLTNACQHSKSEKVRVKLEQRDGDLRVTIQDWGVGFIPGNVGAECFGLEGIRERARLLGGKTSVESVPGEGTCITVELPLVLRE